MKRNALFFILLIFFSLVVASCGSRKPMQPVIIENTKEVIRTIKDTTYVVEADSTYYNAYVECINGKPVLRDPQIKQPSKTESGLQPPKVLLSGNKLTVQCEKIAQELHKQWQETYIKEHEQKLVYIDKPIEVEKKLSWFQKTQIWFGSIFMGLLAIVTITGILRWRKII